MLTPLIRIGDMAFVRCLLAGVIAVAVAAAAPGASAAGRKPPMIAPFPRVSVQLPPPASDPGLVAFRQLVAGVAQRRSFAELERYVSPQDFFWEHDSARRYNAKRSGAENLAAALHLGDESGPGWQLLADFAAEPTASARVSASMSASMSAPGVLCAPGRPNFVQEDLDSLVEATHFAAENWVFPRAAGVALRLSPDAESPLIERLGSYFVRVLRSVTARANAQPLRSSWTRVAAPSGKIGFTAPDTLLSPAAAQLCYARNSDGRWSITGFVSGPE